MRDADRRLGTAGMLCRCAEAHRAELGDRNTGNVFMELRLIGVYLLDAPEPCHLIEIEFANDASDFDWGEVTQEISGQPRDNWQVPWDEQRVDGNVVVGSRAIGPASCRRVAEYG